MKVAPGVEMLEIEAVMADGVPGTLCPTLIWDREDAVLVDAGLPGQLVQLRAAIEGAGVPFEKLTRVITAGHTHGHICLYLPGPRLLVAGDALSVDGGQLVPAPALTVVGAQAAARSLQKLAQYDVERVICYHGGLFAAGARARIAALAGIQPP